MPTQFKEIEPHEASAKVEWHPRAETPPKGHMWASDGDRVWLLWSDGTPIASNAINVLFWCNALIPLAPNQQK